MIAQLSSPPDNSFIHYTLLVIGWVTTTFLTAYLAYRLGLRSKRIEREWSIQDAKTAGRDQFIQFSNQIKTTIKVAPDPVIWVNFFKDNAIDFLTLHMKITRQLQGDEKIEIDEAMRVVVKFANMGHGDIYNHYEDLVDALYKIPEA